MSLDQLGLKAVQAVAKAMQDDIDNALSAKPRREPERVEFDDFFISRAGDQFTVGFTNDGCDIVCLVANQDGQGRLLLDESFERAERACRIARLGWCRFLTEYDLFDPALAAGCEKQRLDAANDSERWAFLQAVATSQAHCLGLGNVRRSWLRAKLQALGHWSEEECEQCSPS